MNLTESPLRQLLALLLLALYLLLCGALWYRERLRQRRAVREAAALATAPEGAAVLLVAHASQTGQAEEIAHETARLLHVAGEPVSLCALAGVDAARLAGTHRALFVVSTCGEGDAPDSAAAFEADYMGQPLDLRGLHYGLLALGDRQYTHFCGFGRALDAWLRSCGAVPLFDTVEMDNGDSAALAAWQRHLGQVAALDDALVDSPDGPAGPAGTPGGWTGWQTPAFAPWTLVERICLNPGSAAAPVFHLELAPPAGMQAQWESGDLVQVCAPADPEQPRAYSIASIATAETAGRVHLLVRQTRRADGTPGLASGWLCQGLALGATVPLRLRAQRNFRLEGNAGRPLILIGNGTGLAGLCAHLRARAAAGVEVGSASGTGAGANWLIFGERQRAHDFHYQTQLQQWLEQGVLQRLDVAFSRDQAARVYVQNLLATQAKTLRHWVLQQGAAIYVCGSLQGMAQGVDAALRTALGEDTVDTLVRTGRYRRDVY